MSMMADKKEFKVPIEASDIWQQVSSFTEDKIFRIGGKLFTIIENGEVVWLQNASEYFSILYRIGMRGDWSDKVTGAVSKSEFFNFARTKAKAFDFIMEYPLYPAQENVYYKNQIAPEKTGRLDELLNFFNPHSPEDRDFLKAAFVTPFWGGSAGKKPAFVFDGADDSGEGKKRGIGKSTIIEVMSRLLGEEYVDMDYRLPVEDMKKRLLGASSRIVRFDNVKSALLSSEAIENLITAEKINGHRMYQGDSSMPNFFTYCFTFNDAAFSKDLAQRAIIVRLDRPEYNAGWEERVNSFIDDFRDEIIADIGAVLTKAPDSNRKQWTRFSRWEKDVLQKCSDKDLGEVIKESQKEVDDDSNFTEEIRDLLMAKISDYLTGESDTTGRTHVNPETDKVAIKTTLVTEWMKEIMGKGVNDRWVRKKLMQNRPEELSKELNKIDGTRFYVWNEQGSRAAWKLVHGVRNQEVAERWKLENGRKSGRRADKSSDVPCPSALHNPIEF